MTLLRKAGNLPRFVKCVCIALLVISVVFFLTNAGITDYIMVEEVANGTEIDTLTLKVPHLISTESPKVSTMNSLRIPLLQEHAKLEETIAAAKTPLMGNISHRFTNEEFTLHILKHDVISCFKNSQEDFTEKPFFRKDLYTSFRRDLLILNILYNFNHILKSLNVEAVIIQPSVLYCMLLPTYKLQLHRKKFNISTTNESKNVFTYGIRSQDILKLQEEQNINKFQEAGFQPYFVQKPIADWMKMNETDTQNTKKNENIPKRYTTHVFYTYYDFTIHLVVFHSRNEYIWHDALNEEGNLNIPHKEHLLFVNHPSAYEKFTFVSMANKSEILTNFYVPSNPHYFLIQIQNSRFLECNSTRAKNFSYHEDLPKSHWSLSVEKFNNQMLLSLRELKALLHPLLMNFWIFSGTMLGWYRECNVIPYTTDVDFAAWASEVEDFEYIKSSLLENKNLTLMERMGVLEEALEFRLDSSGLRVDLFFMYEIKNGSWASGHRPSLGYFFKYYYPHFTLCSAELMGEKVLVPCETEKVILAEYGPEWMKPVSSWNYEASIFNRGPNIYWDKKRLKELYQDY